MDSLSQIVLGGAVGFAVAGKTAPRKAILWGAVIATLPDLDVFVHYPDDLSSFTEHRSWSHSWIIQTCIAPVIAYVLNRFDSSFSFKQWFLLIWLALITHSGLDALTVYGTQLFWPFMPSPYSGGSIFIIDPLYTLPLLIGFLAILIKPLSSLSHAIIKTGLFVSTSYLIWGLFAQNMVLTKTKDELAKQHINSDKILVSASPLNTLLWRILVIDDGVYYEGFRSLLDGKSAIDFKQYNRHPELITQLQSLPSLQRLDWFTNGFYSTEKQGKNYIASDLRMGMEPNYFFRFTLAQSIDNQMVPVQVKRVPSQRNAKQGLSWVWHRIWSPHAQIDMTTH